MIGVILWTDPSDRKAVIWCEDQGDLAYLSNAETTQLPDNFVDVGDWVRFDVKNERNLRLARNASCVQKSRGQNIAQNLRHAAAANSVAVNDSAQVIPFQIPGGRKIARRSAMPQKKIG